jgi:hypothetical protein
MVRGKTKTKGKKIILPRTAEEVRFCMENARQNKFWITAAIAS